MNVSYNGNFFERFIDWTDDPSYLGYRCESFLEEIAFVFLFPFYWILKIAVIVILFATVPIWIIPYLVLKTVFKNKKGR